jgi:hypothetical protein
MRALLERQAQSADSDGEESDSLDVLDTATNSFKVWSSSSPVAAPRGIVQRRVSERDAEGDGEGEEEEELAAPQRASQRKRFGSMVMAEEGAAERLAATGLVAEAMMATESTATEAANGPLSNERPQTPQSSDMEVAVDVGDAVVEGDETATTSSTTAMATAKATTQRTISSDHPGAPAGRGASKERWEGGGGVTESGSGKEARKLSVTPDEPIKRARSSSATKDAEDDEAKARPLSPSIHDSPAPGVRPPPTLTPATSLRVDTARNRSVPRSMFSLVSRSGRCVMDKASNLARSVYKR